jgi:ABC-type uncharacterized transport system YnjBCD ATPase subunit
VVRGPSCLVLAVDRSLRGVFRTGAACLLVDVTIVIGCGLLMVLLAPLLAGLNTLLSALDGDAGRRFPAATRGQLMLGAGGMRGGDIVSSFGGASEGIGRHAERS